MNKPARTGSLRWNVENSFRSVQGYENLDVVLKHVNKDKRADYLFFDRKLVAEQKEYIDSPQHRAKGKAALELSDRLIAKYGIDPSTGTIPVGILSQEEDSAVLEAKQAFAGSRTDGNVGSVLTFAG